MLYGIIGLLVASTVLYSVVNSAQAAGLAKEGSGSTVCSIVHAVCSINADAGFCATATTRACDAMQPSPFAGLVGASTNATFFLMFSSLLMAGVLNALFKLSRIQKREGITRLGTAASEFVNVYKPQLLAGKFPALRF